MGPLGPMCSPSYALLLLLALIFFMRNASLGTGSPNDERIGNESTTETPARGTPRKYAGKSREISRNCVEIGRELPGNCAEVKRKVRRSRPEVQKLRGGGPRAARK